MWKGDEASYSLTLPSEATCAPALAVRLVSGLDSWLELGRNEVEVEEKG